MAARGARAAGRAREVHRRAHALCSRRSARTKPPSDFRAGIATVRLDRRQQRANRPALGRRKCWQHPQIAAELVALAPDVILADSSATVAALLQETRSVPIVFAIVADPVEAGYV